MLACASRRRRDICDGQPRTMNTTSSSPSQKHIVTSRMTFFERETKVFEDKTTGISVKKANRKYPCPQPGCINPVVIFLDKSGYQNPYQYRRSYYTKGKTRAQRDSVLAGLFENAIAEQQRHGGSIRSYFSEKEMYGNLPSLS